MKQLGDLIDLIDREYSNTNQLYGICYALILNIKDLHDLEIELVSKILNSIQSISFNNKKIRYINDGISNNYYVSHFYNFALNLLAYMGLKSFSTRNSYRNNDINILLHDIPNFLNYESTLLDNSLAKTIGFELVIGKYINKVAGFNNKKFIKKYLQLRAQRLQNFSKLLAFSPEGLSNKEFNQFQLNNIAKKLKFPEIFIINSPEASLAVYDSLQIHNNKVALRLKNFLKQNLGFPPFFKGEFYDLFWIIDIINSAGLLDKKIKSIINTTIDRTKALDSSIIGSFDQKKGFAIGKGFSFYDLDTTTVGLRSLYLIRDEKSINDSFDMNYYSSNTRIPSTFRKDNRPSLSVLAHTISYQVVINDINIKLIEYVIDNFYKDRFEDKFHSSALYVLYTLTIAFVDIYKLSNNFLPFLKDVIDKILQFYNPETKLFTSIIGLDGTIEESCWAVLALNYFEYSVNYKRKKIKSIILDSKSTIQKLKPNVENLEKMWVVKEIYTPLIINSVLIKCVMQLNVK